MYQTTFYKIVDKIINKLKINGFKQVSYGTENDLDLERQNDYPLAHIVFPSGNHDEKTTTVSFVIIVADKCDNTGNEYIEYGKDNTIDIQQDLLTRTQTSIKMLDKRYLSNYDSIEIGYDISYDVGFTTFKEDLPNLLTGFIFNVSISFPNMIADTICMNTDEIEGIPSRPYLFGTSGTSGVSGIPLTSTPENGEGSGLIVDYSTGETLLFGEVVHLHTDGKVYKVERLFYQTSVKFYLSVME